MKIVFVDSRIKNDEENNLSRLGYKILKCPPSSDLYYAVSGHPDMLMFIVSSKKIIVHKNMQNEFKAKLKRLNIDVILSQNTLKDTYPEDIILNGVSISNYFVHKLNNTDTILLENIKDKILVNVNQGYTKCSTAIVSETSIMTSDKKIAETFRNSNMDVLYLPPGDIVLPGLNYGFIGGCCSLLEKNLMVFYGDLSNYKYGFEVLKFLKKHFVEPYYLSTRKLIDRGSIFKIEI
jgi:hypothetical protein